MTTAGLGQKMGPDIFAPGGHHDCEKKQANKKKPQQQQQNQNL